jgi:hypothetical protein
LYLCGIRYKYLQSNVQSPFEKPDQSNLKKLALILKYVKRLQGAMPRIKLPMTFDILEKICYRLRKGVFNNFVDCLIETACTVAFFGFLRCGKFTVRNASDFDVTVNLCISDVLFYNDYAVLKLKNLKQIHSDGVYAYNCIRSIILYSLYNGHSVNQVVLLAQARF